MSTRTTSLAEIALSAGYVVPAPTRGDVIRRALQCAFETPTRDAAFHDLIRRIDEIDDHRR